MKILVTDGAGFIGAHLVKKLIDINHKVLVVETKESSGDSFGFDASNTYLKLKFKNNKFVPLVKGLRLYFKWINKVPKIKNLKKYHPFLINKKF